MQIGCVKEIKKHEYRIAMTPANAASYVAHGHRVLIETGAGVSAGFIDEEYRSAGAEITDADSIWQSCDMIVKVKEPLAPEYPKMREGQIIYTFFHLAADRRLTEELLRSGAISVAYETLTDDKGGLPLLKPMSEIAGRLSLQTGARCLEKPNGGSGILLSGVPGVRKAKVLILGAGTVGANAARIAVGMGADVTVMDISLERLTYLDELYGASVQTLYSTEMEIREQLATADLTIGCVLIPGAAAPKLIKKSYLKDMKAGSVIVDVAVDQGGCCETTKVTYHDDPTFTVDGVIHYCVANMPGAVPYTSSLALTNATIYYGLLIADLGVEASCGRQPGIRNAINTYRGKLTIEAVAREFGAVYTDLQSLF